MTLKRKAPLKRSTKPIKRKPVARRSGKPKRFASLRSPEYCAWIRSLSCVLLWRTDPGRDGCCGRTEAAHVKSRGAGGADVGNVVPLCVRHHREQHAIGIKSFERKYTLSLAEQALGYKDMWHRGNPEVPP